MIEQAERFGLPPKSSATSGFSGKVGLEEFDGNIARQQLVPGLIHTRCTGLAYQLEYFESSIEESSNHFPVTGLTDCGALTLAISALASFVYLALGPYFLRQKSTFSFA